MYMYVCVCVHIYFFSQENRNRTRPAINPYIHGQLIFKELKLLNEESIVFNKYY